MRRLTVLFAAVVLAALSAEYARADFLSNFNLDGQTINKAKFTNFEIALRPDDAGAITIGGDNFTSITSGFQVGDVLVQIYLASDVMEYGQSGGPDFTPGQLTGYGAVKVKSVSATQIDYTYVYDTNVGSYSKDPFGKLAANSAEVLRLYFDYDTDFTNNAGLATDVANATDGGNFFASFGFGSAIDGNATYVSGSNIGSSDLYSAPAGAAVNFYSWLNVLAINPSFPVNYGGVAPELGKDTSLYGQANVVPLIGNPSGWTFYSDDPLYARMSVPEPSTVAMLIGLAAVGAGGLIRRRRSK